MDKSMYRIAPPNDILEDNAKQNKSHHFKLSKKLKLVISLAVYLVLIPVLIYVGVVLWQNQNYNIVSLLIVLASCVPFFVNFEKSNKSGARELVVIAVMSAICVISRIIFAPTPSFKPVTALVVITAIAFGPNAGFMVGAMSAVVSNIFFGQGPWTPFQMFSWGMIGFLSGIIFIKTDEKPNILVLFVVGVISGIMFSLLMDIWSVLNMDGSLNIDRYAAAIISSLPTMAMYVLSNLVFLLLLTRPFLRKLNRIKIKYNLFT